MNPEPSIFNLSAPLYIGWQLTNECTATCLHCIEESGPGKAFKDELSKEEVLRIAGEFASNNVPYISFSGGEPLSVPYIFELCEMLAKHQISVKLESNGQLMTRETAKTLASAGVKAVQVSLDGSTAKTYEKLRVGSKFNKTIEALRHLKEAGVSVEINFVPTSFNISEIASTIDLAKSLGAYSFYTGPIMRCGNASKIWDTISPDAAQYKEFFKALDERAKCYKGNMRVYFHKLGIVEELKFRLEHPAAIMIVLANGKVKIINSLPFVCGDLRTQSVLEAWENYKKAWKDGRVAKYIKDLEKDDKMLAKLHDLVELYP
ncbi:radical SAM protein [Elusimicrobiota bacterium]